MQNVYEKLDQTPNVTESPSTDNQHMKQFCNIFGQVRYSINRKKLSNQMQPLQRFQSY